MPCRPLVRSVPPTSPTICRQGVVGSSPVVSTTEVKRHRPEPRGGPHNRRRPSPPPCPADAAVAAGDDGQVAGQVGGRSRVIEAGEVEGGSLACPGGSSSRSPP